MGLPVKHDQEGIDFIKAVIASVLLIFGRTPNTTYGILKPYTGTEAVAQIDVVFAKVDKNLK